MTLEERAAIFLMKNPEPGMQVKILPQALKI